MLRLASMLMIRALALVNGLVLGIVGGVVS